MISRYVLKSKDKILITFDFESKIKEINGINSSCYSISNIIINQDNRKLLPKNLTDISEKSLLEWVKKRKAPKNRQFVEKILAAYNDNSSPFAYVDVCKALSVNDTYWIDNEEFQQKWEDVNLYAHPFDDILAYVAFTGYSRKVTGVLSSPEPTTYGKQKKCWSNRENGIYLLKGASDWLNRGGCSDVYSEFYASQIAEAMGFNHVEYKLEIFKHKNREKELISVCKAFTTADVGYIPFYYVLKEKGIAYNRDLSDYEFQLQLGEVFGSNAFEDMMLFDSIIYNADRHMNNFGMLVDNNTGEIIGSAPLFDHGLSLLVGAASSDLASHESIKEYRNSLISKFDISFDEQAYRFVQHRHLKALKSLCSFKLKPPADYEYNKDYLKILNAVINERAKEIIEFCHEKLVKKQKVL